MAGTELASLLTSLVVLFGLALLAVALYPQRARQPILILQAMVVAYGLRQVRDTAEFAAAFGYASTGELLYAQLEQAFHRLWPLGEAALTLFLFLWFRFSLAFPDEAGQQPSLRRLATAVDLLGAALALEMAANLFQYRQVSLGPLLIEQATVYNVHWAITVIVALAGLAQLTAKYFSTASVLRKRAVKCVAWCMATSLLIGLLFEFPWPLGSPRLVDYLPALENVPIMLFLASMYYVVQRYRTVSVDLWVSRSSVYLLLTVLLATLYIAVVAGLSWLFQAAGDPRLSGAFHRVAAVAIALACLPLWGLVQASLDRLFRRDRYDYRSIMKALSSRLNSSLDLDAVLRSVVEVVRESLRCQRVCLILVQEEDEFTRIGAAVGLPSEVIEQFSLTSADLRSALGDSGASVLAQACDKRLGAADLLERLAPLQMSLWLPLYKDRVVVGLLGVGDRHPVELAAPEDVDLLVSIANHAAVAIANAQLYSRVQALTQDLQAKVEEQTRDLRLANQELRHLNQQAYRLSITDGLTDLHNYRFFHQRLLEELERARRHSYPLSVIFMDLDGLKTVNDRYGHLTGDAALRHVACIIGDETRLADVAARYGGDEFALILPHTSREEAEVVAGRLLKRLEEEPLRDDEGRLVPLMASLGVATYPDDASTERELIDFADRELYAQKGKTGRQGVGLAALGGSAW